MTRGAAIVLALAGVLCSAAGAGAQVESSPIPEPRPGAGANYSVDDLGGVSPQASVGPVRPEAAASAPPVARSPRPEPRPDGLAERAQAVIAATRVSRGVAGSVCGVAAIRGRALSAIPGRVKGCGVEAPVEVTEMGGVQFSTPATIDCPTARALYTWLETGAKPAVGRYGGGISTLTIAASYVCRPRNNQSGAKISEHGRGRAVDVAAIGLADGGQISLLEDWGRGREGRMLRAMHKAACGPFGTVLGPESDGYHHDHLHFDTARYRSGSYCR
ncbi:extensin family protein [Celeribacter indicus]|uniref:Extensin-like C-terminal domain-containing protein n=1 Tax=Celeribacter indicus TaxID=1208324 RepID=A0A0B5DZE3_9RHOB|nr:extensin family protein [Celeribacter indicus]AJE48374.1 hypothetical protein P73_3659 [Celeribacter indicus]SDW74235.1 Uncharacterized conserved protein [Celeribacter indicus]